MLIDGSQTFGGECDVVYTDFKLQCCTPRTYNVINKCYLKKGKKGTTKLGKDVHC